MRLKEEELILKKRLLGIIWAEMKEEEAGTEIGMGTGDEVEEIITEEMEILEVSYSVFAKLREPRGFIQGTIIGELNR